MPPEPPIEDPSRERRWEPRVEACLLSGHPLDLGNEASRSSGQVGVQCRGLAESLGFQFPLTAAIRRYPLTPGRVEDTR